MRARIRLAFHGAAIQYQKLDVIPDSEGDIAFLGLDSMAQEIHWYDRLSGEGELGIRQLDDLREIIGRQEVRSCRFRVIYLHHHPFDPYPFHQLKDSAELERVVKGAIADLNAGRIRVALLTALGVAATFALAASRTFSPAEVIVREGEPGGDEIGPAPGRRLEVGDAKFAPFGRE